MRSLCRPSDNAHHWWEERQVQLGTRIDIMSSDHLSRYSYADAESTEAINTAAKINVHGTFTLAITRAANAPISGPSKTQAMVYLTPAP
jgi:hypothetical protein